MVFFLESIHWNPEQKELLTYVSSVNLTREGHYFAFDEALEFFGVKFVKQNITGKVTDLENLMLQIKSVQSEHECMMLLFSEFVEDNTVVKGSHAAMQRKEVLWSLVNELDKAFNLPDPKMHDFFKNAKEMNESGFVKMFESYEIGIKRLNHILHQDIYKTEPQSKIGRRKKFLSHIKVSEQNEYNKEQNPIKTKQINDDLPAVIEETLSATSDERVQVRSSLPKNKKYTEEEQVILQELLNHSIELQKEVGMRIYEELVKINNTWTYKKVRDYW